MKSQTMTICLASPRKIDPAATRLPDNCTPQLIMTCNICGMPIVNAQNAVLSFDLAPRLDIPTELLGQDERGRFIYRLPGSVELLHEECFTGPGLSVPAWTYISSSSKITYKPQFQAGESQEGKKRPN